MQSLENLNDLFVDELRDLYDAEKQLTDALPLLAQAAKSEQLRVGFEQHLEQTRTQIERLDSIFKGLGEKPEGRSCKAMAGLVAEAKDILAEDVDPDVMDSALIVAAQKVEHYEIAGYGSVRTFAKVLGYSDAEQLLERSLKEEAMTDQKLNVLASQINERALHADEAGD